MAGMRSYNDGCGIAHALDVAGERWALLVVRELLFGPKRFADLRVGLPGVSANILAQRLRELEQARVLVRRTLAPPAGSRVYELTEWGRELEPVLVQLGKWGLRSAELPRDAPISVDAVMLSLRARFDARAAEGVAGVYELRFGADRFRAVVADGRFELSRGVAENPVAVIESGPRELDLVVSGDKPMSALTDSGEMTVHGDKRAAERFTALFTLD
ncbi:MAG: helix-turn-helix transcriptional regulator [Mycobacteriaceae bacterium]|nr:helix-turn-helix transcriptional regulator [Mycobacteriaceae bacterium]